MLLSPSMNMRIEALEILGRWERGGVFAETLIEEVSSNPKVSVSDKAFLMALVFGVLRHKTWLDYLIDKCAGKRFLQSEVRNILRVGICQLFILKMPAYAAVNETVNLTPHKATGLVNAILRRILREEEALRAEWETLPWDIKYSTPHALVARWKEAFGPAQTEKLLDHQQKVPQHYARRNPLVDWPANEWGEGVVAHPTLADWFVIEGRLPLAALQAGALYMADPSTRHALELLAPQAGEVLLDACAAPGGKAVALLSATGGKLDLTATDSASHRLPRLRENLEKFSPTSLKVGLCDWSQACLPEFKKAFDATLLDVPCSNTGVMQRRVDVRWRFSSKEMERLVKLQRAILEQGAMTVRSGGRLVYSTCSIDPQENTQQVAAFLERHPEWSLVEERLILPSQEEGDGAYAALLKRA